MIAQGRDRLSLEQIDRAVELARVRYSTDRPRRVVEDVVADGSGVLPWPAGWMPGCPVLDLETPPDQVPPQFVERASWSIYTAPSGEQLRLHRAITAGQAVRVYYVDEHVLSASECTVPAAHFEAVAAYAAGSLAEVLATMNADNTDATIAADRIDQNTPAREWSRRANALRNRYFAVLGIQASGGTAAPKADPASAVAVMELTPSFGRPHMYPRGRR